MKHFYRTVSCLLLIALFFTLLPPPSASAATTLNVMSYNLKNSNYSFGDVTSMITSAGAEIIGVQEATIIQYPLLSAAMSAKGFSGIQGQNRGDGECTPIFYNSSKLTLLRSGSYWLSDTPTTQSKFEESSYYRICTWGYFQVKNTSQYIMFYNTHLDFQVATNIKQSNVMLADMIVKTNELTNAKSHIIITGDFNAGTTSAAFKYILGDVAYNGVVNPHTKQRLDEARQIASKTVANSSGNYYTQPSSGPTADLDHIFVTSEGFDCSYYQVLSDAAGSDHLPILAKLTFKSPAHKYSYTWEKDGYHCVTCPHCSYNVSEACTMEDDHCTLCGGGGTETFRLVTDQNDLTDGRYLMVAAAAHGSYLGSYPFYGIGLKQDSGYRGLVSYGLNYTELPETITLSGGDNGKLAWKLTGNASGFTLQNLTGDSVYHGSGYDLLLGNYTATTFTGTMSTTTHHVVVKHNGTSYLSLRTDINTLNQSDVKSPLVGCVGNTSTGNYKIFFFKKYEECLHENTSTVTVSATCVANGSISEVCDACGEVLSTEEISALGHTYTESITTQASCANDGVKTFTCECGDSYTEAIAALGHSYSSTVIAPTCTAQGYTLHTCSRCKDSYKDSYVTAEGHTYTASITKQATCTTEGVKTFTCDCGESYTEAISALGHSYSSTVIAPTCTTQGYTLHICSRCNDSYKDGYVTAEGHTYTASITTQATCTTEGVKTFTCDCGSSYTQVIAVLGHSYSSVVIAPTCTQRGYTQHTCTRCGNTYTDSPVSALGHTYTSSITTAPTCTKSGVKTFTCSCGTSYTQPISALGHSYTSVVISATCLQQGYTLYSCTTCGSSYKSSYTPITDHSYRYANNGSNHTITCAWCTYSLSQEHTYSNGLCVCGAKKVEYKYVLDSSLSFSMNISVGAQMKVIYTIMGSQVNTYDDFYLVVTKAVADAQPVTVVYGFGEDRLEPETSLHPTTGEPFMYKATFDGINAKEMGDVFTAALYVVSSDGTIRYSRSNSSSIKDYLTQKLNDSTSQTELKTLAVDMLNYGAAAQIRLGYDTDQLANADLTSEQLAYGTKAIPEANNSSTTYGDGSTITTSISVTSQVELYLNCVYSPTETTGVQYVLTNMETGELLGVLPATVKGGVMCQAVYQNVGAKEMRNLIGITMFDNGTVVSKTLVWSVESYVAATRAKSNVTQEELNMVNAMLTYGDSAAAYFTSIGQ